MKFDSTTYLVFYLQDKLKYGSKAITHCISILEGFSIQPGSIKYDEISNLLTLSAFLPNSDLNVLKVTISVTNINILLSAKDTIININCEIYSDQMQASAIIERRENICAGIYYYDSRVLNREHPTYINQGLISYYDVETINTINKLYMHDFKSDGLNLNDIVGYNQDKIKTLGFVPDITEWHENGFNKKDSSYSDFAMKINNQLKNFDYDSFMKSLAKFAKKPETVINPVTKK